MEKITINNDQSLYVFNNGGYVSCLGFDVVLNRLRKLSDEMNAPVKPVERGTLEAYHEYERLTAEAGKRYRETGWRSKSELIPEFIGHEGERVEVVTSYGETERFYIGKSTGFIPVHLEIKKSNSSGGCSVSGHPFKRITFLGKRR